MASFNSSLKPSQKPMRRSPIRRVPPRVPQSDPAIFEIETKDGDRYIWPVEHMPEEGADGWRATVEGWAILGDNDTMIWHAQTSETTRSKKGWFDDAIFQPRRGYHVLAELKVRDREGDANTPSTAQWRYISAALKSGVNVQVWTWPDDGRLAFESLTGQPYEVWLGKQVGSVKVVSS